MPPKSVAIALLDSTARATLEWKIHWLLRLALFCEFVGHGAFGVLTKQAWLAYFALFGIPEAWAGQAGQSGAESRCLALHRACPSRLAIQERRKTRTGPLCSQVAVSYSKTQ